MLFIAVIVSCLVFTNITLCVRIFFFSNENEGSVNIDPLIFQNLNGCLFFTAILANLFLILLAVKKYLTSVVVRSNYYVVSGTRAPPVMS